MCPAAADTKHEEIKLPKTMSLSEKPLESVHLWWSPEYAKARHFVDTGGIPQPVGPPVEQDVVRGEIARAGHRIGRRRRAVAVCKEVDDGTFASASFADEDDMTYL